MKNTKTNSTLQAHLRQTLSRLRELDKLEVDLAVHGQCSLRLQRLKAAYGLVSQEIFDAVEWDPG